MALYEVKKADQCEYKIYSPSPAKAHIKPKESLDLAKTWSHKTTRVCRLNLRLRRMEKTNEKCVREKNGISKKEIPLMFIRLALLIGSFYWRFLFHFFFIVPSLLFFMRSMDDFKKGNKKSMYWNMVFRLLCFALIFLANTD